MNLRPFRDLAYTLGVIAVALAACQARPVSNTPTPAMPKTNDGAPMVRVPAGEFSMGSSILNEQPQHMVKLNEFWMDTFEVTNALYKRCVEAGVCRPPASTRSAQYATYYGDPAYGDHPVNQVAWDDAVQYCRWASKHLPTEAEWEKAARGTDARLFPWGNTWEPTYVNSLLSDLYDTMAVGSYPEGASPYRAMDMAGNVWEWVADWYAEDYYAHAPHENPQGPATGEARIVRGGGYGVYDAAMRVSLRRDLSPDTRATYVGFRCAR
jgi:formylglycine-generating enzyme required for sulfatase activity